MQRCWPIAYLLFCRGVIHKDQVGFVPGREARDNTTKTIHLISYIQRQKLKTCLLSFHAEKEFDRVNWRFLRLFLEKIGLVTSFISMVMFLYSQPSASVLVNGTSSEPFDISNGTHQVSPLSPLLFVIVIEHLVCAIRQNASIQGIPTPSFHHKLSLYADDLLVYIQQPHTSLPSLFLEFRHFGPSVISTSIYPKQRLSISFYPLLRCPHYEPISLFNGKQEAYPT